MPNRNAIIQLKSSNVTGLTPTIGNLTLGEIAINTADARAYSLFTGGLSGATSVRQIGWDRLSLTGGTLTGALVGTTISATTFSGNGSALTGMPDIFTTGGTFSNGTATFTNNNNSSFNVTGFTTGGSGITRSVNNISANTPAGATSSTDYVYFVTGTVTITLPTAIGNTNKYTIKNVGNGIVSITTTSGQLIDDGTAPITITRKNNSLDFIPDGTNFKLI